MQLNKKKSGVKETKRTTQEYEVTVGAKSKKWESTRRHQTTYKLFSSSKHKWFSCDK